MKKVLRKIKKIFYTLGIILLTGKQNIVGAVSLYGNVRIDIANETNSSVKESFNFLKFAKTMILPLIFIIGAFIYFKKSKNSVKNKIIYITAALLVIIFIYIKIYY